MWSSVWTLSSSSRGTCEAAGPLSRCVNTTWLLPPCGSSQNTYTKLRTVGMSVNTLCPHSEAVMWLACWPLPVATVIAVRGDGAQHQHHHVIVFFFSRTAVGLIYSLFSRGFFFLMVCFVVWKLGGAADTSGLYKCLQADCRSSIVFLTFFVCLLDCKKMHKPQEKPDSVERPTLELSAFASR